MLLIMCTAAVVQADRHRQRSPEWKAEAVKGETVATGAVCLTGQVALQQARQGQAQHGTARPPSLVLLSRKPLID